jgi:RHS repeat-associated protein
LVTFTAYDFKGNPLERARTVVSNDALLGAFAGPLPGWQVAAFRVDWTNPAAVPLESGTYVTTASFDALNRITRVSYPEDVEHERRALKPSYDEAGRLEQLMLERTDAAGPTSDTFVQRIAYDAGGRRVLVAYGNGLMTRYAYDPRSLRLLRLRTEAYEQPADLTYRRTGPVRQDVAYEYDLVGNVLTMEEHTPDCGIPGSPQGQDALQRKFVCDALSRLRSATGRECDLPPDVPWDDTPRCVDLTRTRAYQETYVYDAAGNLQQLKHLVNGGGFTRGFNLSPGTNRLDSLAVGAAPTGYTYDASGNMTRETTSRHFEWDYADRMRVYRTQVDGSEPSVHAQYLYDVAGQRVKKLVRKQGGRVEVTVSIDGLFEHQQVIEAGGTEENNTLHVLDEQARIATVRVGAPFTQDATPAVKYHLNDHLGSSTVVVDDTGTPINREEYTPYGETSFGSFARKRYRFTGKERDEESGLYYHGARYYLPWLARWATCDPAGPAATQNAYAYAANPLAFVDPRGMEPRCVTRYTNESPLPSEGNPHPLQIEGSITICKPPAGGRPSTTAAPDATPQPDALPNLPPPPAQPETVQTVQETVITGEIPFEPEVSYGPALEAAQGRGHIEMGDVAQFGKGLYHGVIEAASILFGPLLGSVIEHNAPRMAVDPRYAGAEMMGRQLGENLSYEATAGVGLIASKGLKATEAIGATLSKSKALSTATGSGRAYSVAVEVELQSVWGPGIPNELRRNLHRIEAQELIAEQVQKLLKSADPVERKAGRQLVKLLADPSEWNVHHDAFRQGMMQLVPRAQHYARELQDLLHPYIIPFVRRVGGFAIWGHLY